MSAADLARIIDLGRFEDWQRQLIYEPKLYRNQGSDEAQQAQQRVAQEQKTLAEAVEAGPSAAFAYLLGRLGVSEADIGADAIPVLPKPLTVAEMRSLPAFAEGQIAIRLHQSIVPAQAADPAFWTLCHAFWMRSFLFGSDLGAVFFDGPKADNGEARTRNFLRRVGGLRRVRGNVSPLTDCPIAMAWWRWRVALEVSEETARHGDQLTTAEAHEALRQPTVWENLALWSIRRVTSLSAPPARAAVVAVLARQEQVPSGSKATHQIQSMMREVARVGHTHSYFDVPWPRLLAAAEQGIDDSMRPGAVASNGELDGNSHASPRQ
ncbi:hypothetical protein [Candidatus Poriferisodalis sp.]|uniref:hypothetical protein n=1 Tax=Candidatus Poriferisodalis sp. TaxID=3101277 RepID=UPI003B0112E5